jgi:hypothetical protein
MPASFLGDSLTERLLSQNSLISWETLFATATRLTAAVTKPDPEERKMVLARAEKLVEFDLTKTPGKAKRNLSDKKDDSMAQLEALTSESWEEVDLSTVPSSLLGTTDSEVIETLKVAWTALHANIVSLKSFVGTIKGDEESDLEHIAAESEDVNRQMGDRPEDFGTNSIYSTLVSDVSELKTQVDGIPKVPKTDLGAPKTFSEQLDDAFPALQNRIQSDLLYKGDFFDKFVKPAFLLLRKATGASPEVKPAGEAWEARFAALQLGGPGGPDPATAKKIQDCENLVVKFAQRVKELEERERAAKLQSGTHSSPALSPLDQLLADANGAPSANAASQTIDAAELVKLQRRLSALELGAPGNVGASAPLTPAVGLEEEVRSLKAEVGTLQAESGQLAVTIRGHTFTSQSQATSWLIAQGATGHVTWFVDAISLLSLADTVKADTDEVVGLRAQSAKVKDKSVVETKHRASFSLEVPPLFGKSASHDPNRHIGDRALVPCRVMIAGILEWAEMALAIGYLVLSRKARARCLSRSTSISRGSRIR